MNDDLIRGRWNHIREMILAQWGQLTDEDIDTAHGHREYLVDCVCNRYGIGKDLALQQVLAFERSL